MNIESTLRKEGIEVIKQLNTLKVNSIATNIAKNLVDNFPEQNFNYHELFAKFSRLNMYIAKIPNGVAAKYFYKNSSIYFSECTDLEKLNDVAIHECIHFLQSEVNSKNKLVKLGLCDFTDIKLSGMALNEAAVQLMTMKCTKTKFDTVKYFDIELPSNSPNYYTLECNLVRQMAYITGEYVLYNSTLYGNDNFKEKFITLTSKEDFEIIKKSNKLKNLIRKGFLMTQNRIFTSFFDNLFQSLGTPKSMANFRNALYTYRNLIGVTDDYTFFNDYYINKMAALEEKYESIQNKSVALVPIKDTLFGRLIRKIRTLTRMNTQEKYNYNSINMR